MTRVDARRLLALLPGWDMPGDARQLLEDHLILLARDGLPGYRDELLRQVLRQVPGPTPFKRAEWLAVHFNDPTDIPALQALQQWPGKVPKSVRHLLRLAA